MSTPYPLTPTALRSIKRVAPALLLGVTFAGYLLLAFWFDLLPNYATTPVLDIRVFAPTLRQGLLYAALLLALFGAYLALYRQVYSGRFAPRLWQITAVSALFSLPLLLAYPINANDIFRYVVRGRISSVYGANPFLMAPDAFPGDIYVAYSGEWRAATSPYGPLWESLAALLTRLSGDNLLLALLLFKLLGLLAVAAVTVLLWRLLAESGSRPRQAALTLLWAWNPAILLSFVANGHNDALMLAALLLGFLVLRRGHAGPGMLLALVAPLIKPIALLALPFFFVSAWRAAAGGQARWLLLLWTAAGGAALVLLAFWPYGDPTVILPRLIVEATGGSSFAPFTLFFLLAQDQGWRLPFEAIIGALPLLFLAVYGLLLWATWHGRSPAAGTARAFFAYLLQALNFRIWYASWPFPWLLVDAGTGDARALRAAEAGVWFLLTTQLSVLIYGHMRFDVFQGTLLAPHVLGVLGVFVLPLLLAAIVRVTPGTPGDTAGARA